MVRPAAIMRRSGVPHTGVHQRSYESAAAGRPVEYRVLTPPGWTGGERLPLLLVLHGANSSAAALEAQLPAVRAGLGGRNPAAAAGRLREHADRRRVLPRPGLAFSEPDRFIAVAAGEPAVFPGETADQVGPRNTLGVLRTAGLDAGQPGGLRRQPRGGPAARQR